MNKIHHKHWNLSSEITLVSSASKSDFLTSSLVIPGQCNFRCSREEWIKVSPRRLKTETFGYGSTPLQKTGMFGVLEVNYHQTHSARDWLSILRTPYTTQNFHRKRRTEKQTTTKARKRKKNSGLMKIGVWNVKRFIWQRETATERIKEGKCRYSSDP